LPDKKADGTEIVYFTSLFFHPVRLRHTVVAGLMSLTPDESGNRIKRLEETYEKYEKFNPLYSIVVFYEHIIKPGYLRIWDFISPIVEFSKAILKNLLTAIFIFGIFLVVYVNFAYKAFSWPSKEVLDGIKGFTLWWFVAGYLIQQFMPMLKNKVSPELDVRNFTRHHQDLEYMAKEMDGADSVQIVSGDFSFIDTNSKLEARLRDLAFARKLKLISYKDRETVEEEMSAKTSSNDILLKLKDEGLIYFDFPIHAKISLIEHGGSKRMLFRFTKEVGGRQVKHMGFIRHGENTRALLDVIERFLSIAKN
jgi:hypothetical protein